MYEDQLAAPADGDRDDIGLVSSLDVIPPDVLGAVSGVDPSVFAAIRKRVEPVTIVRKR